MTNHLRVLRKERGLTLKDVAEGTNTTPGEIWKLEHGQRRITLDWARRLARVFQVTEHEIMTGARPMVAVAGYVGAGAEIIPFDDHAAGAGIDEVRAPPGLDPDRVVAVRVKGDSMFPIEDGWILFYRKDVDGVPEDALGRFCIVKLRDGRMLAKQVRRGPTRGRFNLVSSSGPIIEDAEVIWAARVLSMLPGDMGLAA